MEHERCEQCGFDGSTYDDGALLAAIDGLGPRWRDALTRAGAELRRRPAPEVWSAIEYGAHTRDITALHVFGVEQALTGSEPVFGDIDADALIDRRGGELRGRRSRRRRERDRRAGDEAGRRGARVRSGRMGPRPHDRYRPP